MSWVRWRSQSFRRPPPPSFLLLPILSRSGRSLLSRILLCFDESFLCFQLWGKIRDESGERKVNWNEPRFAAEFFTYSFFFSSSSYIALGLSVFSFRSRNTHSRAKAVWWKKKKEWLFVFVVETISLRRCWSSEAHFLFFPLFFLLPIVTNPEIRARGNAPNFTALTQRFHPRHHARDTPNQASAVTRSLLFLALLFLSFCFLNSQNVNENSSI